MLKLVKSEHDKFLIDIQKLHDNVIFFFFYVSRVNVMLLFTDSLHAQSIKCQNARSLLTFQ